MSRTSTTAETAETLEVIPRKLAALALFHLAEAVPLPSHSEGGLTLYALTVRGARGPSRPRWTAPASPAARPDWASRGGASLAGPAVDAAGLTAGWPAAARRAAAGLFAAAPRKAGAVAVIVLVQFGAATHGVVIWLGEAREAARAP